MSDIYRDALLERLNNPINQRSLNKPDLSARLVNPLCGDEVLLQLRVKKETIEQAAYSGNGCAISQVAASILVEKIEGRKLSEIKKFTENDILDSLGVSLGPARLKCALLSLQVLQKALNES